MHTWVLQDAFGSISNSWSVVPKWWINSFFNIFVPKLDNELDDELLCVWIDRATKCENASPHSDETVNLSYTILEDLALYGHISINILFSDLKLTQMCRKSASHKIGVTNCTFLRSDHSIYNVVAFIYMSCINKGVLFICPVEHCVFYLCLFRSLTTPVPPRQ